MSRRRRTPWIHRWSRPIIGAIAVLGATNTLYLTITRFLGGETACPADGCGQVLGSRYATLFADTPFKTPLALYGLLAYVAMAALALAPLLIKTDTQKELRRQWEKRTWLMLFLGATAMMIFSARLMFIMVNEFVDPSNIWGSICLYCIASAIFSTLMFVFTIIGRAWDDVGQLFFSGFIVAVVTLILSFVIYIQNTSGYNIVDKTDKIWFSITESSNSAQIELAQHLKSSNATMYGAYWCPHCYDQKKLFGVEALADLPYVECDPKGVKAEPEVCQAKFQEAEQQLKTKVGFPTWEINGKFYSGAQPLSDLAQFSNYDGPQNF